MRRTKIGDFEVKPVKISGFSILAHACSCLLMLAHVYSLNLFCHQKGSHVVKIQMSKRRSKIVDFEVKPVKFSGFSILAHACSCLLMWAHLLFFVTIEGLMMSN